MNWPTYNFLFNSYITSCFKSILYNVNITTSVFFWWVFAQILIPSFYFHPIWGFTFKVFFYFYEQNIVGLYLLKKPNNIFISTEVFNPFKFNIITNIDMFKYYFIIIFIFLICSLFLYPSSLDFFGTDDFFFLLLYHSISSTSLFDNSFNSSPRNIKMQPSCMVDIIF